MANRESAEEALRAVEACTATVQIGKIYDGTVSSIKEFGAFVEILPGRDGLCHISELSTGYISSIDSVVSVGDAMKVLVIDVDEHDRVKLSRRKALEELGVEDEMAAATEERDGDRGSSDRGGSDRGPRGGGGDRGGSDRGSSDRGGSDRGPRSEGSSSSEGGGDDRPRRRRGGRGRGGSGGSSGGGGERSGGGDRSGGGSTGGSGNGGGSSNGGGGGRYRD